MESSKETNNSYKIYKNEYKKQIKAYNKIKEKIKNIKKLNIFRKSIKKRKKQKEQNHNKTTTRKQYNNLIDKGLAIPFSLPNFKQVIKCSLTIVVYERPL